MELRKAVTARAVILSLLLIAPNSYWLAQRGMVWGGAPTTLSLFSNVIFVLFILTLINHLLKKHLPKSAFSQGELTTIYGMLCVASSVSGYDMIQISVTPLTVPAWFARPENEWETLFWRYIPRWITVWDKESLSSVYEGKSTLYTANHIRTWLSPVLWWSGFMLALVSIMLCINVIIRKQWIEKEKLAYPIVQLPLEMVRGGSDLLSNRLLWVGFAIAGVINIINSAHYIYPSIPKIPLRDYELGHLFTDKPFNAMGWTPISFFPFAIGLTFFMTLDLSFSFWFFYLFWKAQAIIAATLGLRAVDRTDPQFLGAYIGILLILLWTGRHHFRQVFRKIWKNEPADPEEPMQYRKAFYGIVAGLAFLTFFLYKAEMSLWVIAAFLTSCLAFPIVITRIRAELGPPVHELFHMASRTLTTLFGVRRIGMQNLTVMAFPKFTQVNRSHIMPQQLETFKMGERMKLSTKRLPFALTLAAAVGILAGYWVVLHTFHRVGVDNVVGSARPFQTMFLFTELQTWGNNPTGVDGTAVSRMGLGLCVVFAFTFMRRRFLWWRLHPIAYPLALEYGLSELWFSILLSWCIKTILLKYGGMKAHRKAVPFFLGLIMGEFVIGSLWSILGIIFQFPTYNFWH